eukprot:TRINITY_DN19450_c0_g1_i1.p1 TRINITY_DN19450_c0_g1~~TRINITY_DN19450_c0_g1_i1.p1  ORF type:complete len:546 (-),score=94.08 TRINITY_DN19450_c0_g1_i1:402-2039(-)
MAVPLLLQKSFFGASLKSPSSAPLRESSVGKSKTTIQASFAPDFAHGLRILSSAPSRRSTSLRQRRLRSLVPYGDNESFRTGWEKGSLERDQLIAKASAAGAPADEPASPALSKEFKRVRLITFACMFVGYSSFYLTRNSLAYTAPAMVDAGVLDKIAVGGLTSVLPIAYGFSKGLSGVLGGKTRPTLLLAGGLAVTALINLSFGTGNVYMWFLVCCAANGLLQGLGAPACARVLTTWFTSKERGTYWGFWTASHNVGGLLSPILSGTAARVGGWRWGMYAPGLVALTVSLLLTLLMKDDPESAGFPPVEAAKPKPVEEKSETDEKKPSLLEIFYKEVLKSPYLWLFAVAYFFVYVVRQGVTSWFIFYLKEMGIADAPVRVSGLELGGLLGSLSSGFLSDYLLRKNTDGKAGNVGLRVKVVIAYAIMLATGLALFRVTPNIAWLQWIVVAFVGFALYGPQMLIGLCGAETVSKPAVSAAQGLLGWISYLGAANAGLPLSIIVKQYGWDAYFTTLIASCVILILLVLPMINLKSYVQKEEQLALAT